MEKILVPTDFSDNSKPGLRFAIRLAARNKSQLVFINVHLVKRPLGLDSESAGSFEEFKQKELKKTRVKLESFVKRVYQSLKLEGGEYVCEVIEGIKADFTLIDYCKNHPDIKYLVISTRGASYFNKVLGTNTGNLITKSPIPVIAVPKDYRYKPLRNILYASDFENLDSEFQRVLGFAKPRGLSVELLHFDTPSTKEFEDKFSVNDLEMKAGYPLIVRKEKYDLSHPMSRNLNLQIEKIQPSMVVLFTNQKRKLFEKIFLSSMAEGLSFKIQTPLLVFKKD